jgi:hypothetical protein
MPVGWAIVVVVQWVAIIVLAAVVLGVLRQVTPHLERAGGPPPNRARNQGPAVGSTLPPFTCRENSGEIFTAPQLLGQPAVLLFLSATCAPCMSLADEMATADMGELASSLIVVTDPDDRGRLRLPERVRVLAMPHTEVEEVFSVRGRPFALAVGGDGVVKAKRGLNTVAQLADLTTSVVPRAIAVRASISDAP